MVTQKNKDGEDEKSLTLLVKKIVYFTIVFKTVNQNTKDGEDEKSLTLLVKKLFILQMLAEI